MAHIKESIVINAPPDKVHALARDPLRWSTWYSGLSDPKSVEGDGGAGTVVEHDYLMAGIHFPVTTQVTKDCKNPDGSCSHRNEFEGPLSGWQTWEYIPKDGGTEVVAEIEYSAPGKALGKVADRLIIERMQERAARETLERLKVLVEAS
jgi:uncharacterized membrane protein